MSRFCLPFVLLLAACSQAPVPVAAPATGSEASSTAAASDGGAAAPQPPTGHAPVVFDDPGRAGDLVVGTPFPGIEGWVDEGTNPETDCGHFSGGSLPAGVFVMVTSGRITRFESEASAEDVVGPFGLSAGMSEAEARSALPAGAAVEPHAYGDTGDIYLTWTDPATGRGVRAEIVSGFVEQVIWGDGEAIQLIEGCS